MILSLLGTRMASTVIQAYLKHLLDAFFHTDVQLRKMTLNVIELVLKQSLVCPIQVCWFLSRRKEYLPWRKV